MHSGSLAMVCRRVDRAWFLASHALYSVRTSQPWKSRFVSGAAPSRKSGTASMRVARKASEGSVS